MKYFLKPGINFHLSRKLFIPFLAFLSSSLIAQYPERTFYITSDGDDDCSDMHCGLQAAFDSCANDSANYTLLLANGMYAGTYTLEPDSGYCYGDIFLDGGWDTDFSGKTEGHGTVIDGNGQGQPLRVNKYKGKSPGSITINGLKVINGYTEFPGGGMLIETFGYPITVNNCVVMNNQTWNDEAVGRSGGGIFTYSFNTSTNQGGKIIYTNNYIAGNKAGLGAAFGQGGGIFTYACDSLILINNCIVNNQALGSNGVGGGIELYSRGAVVLFINNVFTGNYAEISGGGTANHVTSPVSGSDFLYINNIIYGNSRGSGFGYGIDAYSAVKNVDDKLVTISYDHNIIGYHSTYPGTIEPVMTDNLNTDPVFVDSLYHIAPSSPAVDAGIDDNDRIPGSDFFGNQRIKFGKIDIGVHEQDGLVARYNLDGNAEDESPNGIDGYFYSAPGNGIKENIIGAAHIMLDTQRILIPHHRELNIPHELTISLWFNADNLDNPAHLVNKGYTCHNNGNFHIYLGKGNTPSMDFDCPTFSYFDGIADHYWASDDTIRKGEWNHLALTYNFETHAIEMYLNSNQVGGSWMEGSIPTGTGPVVSAYPMGIGASITSEDGCNGKLAGEGQYPFYGKIDEVFIYNRILPSDDIFEIVNKPPYRITLSSYSINENSANGSVVAYLNALDPNNGEEHTFSLVEGETGNHNALFTINNGNELTLASELNYEIDPQCKILLETEDERNNRLRNSFNIIVNDMNDIPTLAQALEDQSLVERTPWSYTFSSTTFVDEDTWDHLAYSATLEDGNSLPGWMELDPSGRTFSGTPTEIGIYQVMLIARDDSSAVVSDIFQVQVEPNAVPLSETLKFRIYPQPANEYIIVETSSIVEGTLNIMDITGKSVLNSRLEAGKENSINLSGIPDGIYFYRLESGNMKAAGKLVVQ